jgi:pimeloyl-ACP methyl ester carboxylesterase
VYFLADNFETNTTKSMKKFLRIVLYILAGLVAIILILAAVLWIKSPGKAEPFTNEKGDILPGSISVIEKVKLGGLEQYLIIRGADTTKPVMLFLHGGPGSPELPFMKKLNRDIENDFIMVYWEQRGAGKSYSKDIPIESMNISQFISDTRELSEYLIKRFNREKIYVMGHSWGTLLGLSTAYQYPELYYAYFGVGQVAHQYKGEKISFEWVKQQAIEKNDNDAIEELNQLVFPDSLADVDDWANFLMKERQYVNKYGGAMRNMKSMWPMISMVLNTKEYTFADKINYSISNLFSIKNLWLDVINSNLNVSVDSMQIPVYIFQGIHDYQTPYTVAKDFFENLKAPQKEFFTFENSAHSPLMEEAEKFNSIVKKLSENKN